MYIVEGRGPGNTPKNISSISGCYTKENYVPATFDSMPFGTIKIAGAQVFGMSARESNWNV